MSETTPSPTVATWSYRSGGWFAIFGARVTILLPESQKDRVVALWALVDGGEGFDEVLDGLLSAGLSRVPGFVLVSTDDGPTRILLRGAGVTAVASATEGDVSLDGAASHTWVERTIDGLMSLQVDLPAGEPATDEASEGAVETTIDLPILTGLVRVGRINLPPITSPVPVTDADVAPDASAPVMVPAPEPVAEAGPLDDDGPATELMEAISDPLSDPLPDPLSAPLADPLPVPLPDPLPVLLPDPVPDPVPDPLSDPLPDAPISDVPPPPSGDTPDGWVTPWDAPPAPLVEPDTPAVPPVDLTPEEGRTEVVPTGWPPPPTGAPVADAPPLPIGAWEPIGGTVPPPSPPAEAAPFDVDHDGATSSGAATEAADPGSAPATGGSGSAVAQLLISDGQTVLVDGAVLIGRAPEARRFTSTEQPMLVTVPSRLHEISSTHVEVRPGTGADHGSAVVTDMGSTNGTVLVQPGLGPEDLKPGIAVPLIPGAIINLGDGITIQVTRP